MTPADLQRFISERGLTRRAFGRTMGISQDRLRRLLAGRARVPGMMSLACSALAYGLPEWPSVDFTSDGPSDDAPRPAL